MLQPVYAPSRLVRMCPTLLWDVRERPGHDSARLCVGYQVPTSHMWALRVSAQHYHDSLKVTQLREETGSVEAVCRFVVGEQGVYARHW
jgi:hypothetical protein